MDEAGKYTCANCGRTFNKGWSDEEAEAEAVEAFGAVPDDPVLLCDDCYEELMRWWQRVKDMPEDHPAWPG